jgi:hypothetical protein
MTAMRLATTSPKPLRNMRISMKDATMALGMLLEIMSIRATMRLTGFDLRPDSHSRRELPALAGRYD